MRRAKRMAALLLTAAMIVTTATAAFALPSGGWVPTKSVNYDKNGQNWEQTYTRDLYYSKSGKISKVIVKNSDGSTSKQTFKWKGNHVIKQSGDNYGYTYKYKGKQLKSWTYSNSGNNETVTIKWKKNTGTYTTKYVKQGTITINSKGQVTKVKYVNNDGSVDTETYKYYGNGNKKSTSYSSSGYSYTATFNSSGFLTSQKETYDGNHYTSKYTYKKNKKGQITERLCKWTSNSGSGEWKTKYTKWKKVDHVMNTDSFWFNLPLG